MALFNEIQVGRFNRYVQKLLAIKGQAPMPTVSSDLQVVKTFPENLGADYYLGSIDLFGFQVTTTGLAANISFLELRNPSGSNVAAVIVLACAYETAAADQFALNLYKNATADQGTLLSGSSALPWDRRSQRIAPTCIASWNQGSAFVPPSVAAGGRTIIQLAGAANSPQQLIPLAGIEIPLMPGDAAGISTVSQAVALNATIWWRERYLEDSERT